VKRQKASLPDAHITQRLVLRGMKVDELRALGSKHLELNVDSLTAPELRQRLASATETNQLLRKELGESPFSFKPSFYLMIANVQSDFKTVLGSATKFRRVFFESPNSELREDSTSPLKDFDLIHISSPAEGILELQITWHHILYYLSTDAKYEHVYALKAGFVFVDVSKEKALFCCHTTAERDILAKACKQRLGVTFSPISLTKQLLANIGSFEAVRRAGYFTAKPASDESEEATYADERLWKKGDALKHENNPNSARKHSFYRIDLGGVTEAGLGVTSDTAKFWISSDTAVETTRDYGLLLLKRFTSTLKKMKEAGDIPGILKVLSIHKSIVLASITGPEARQDITELAHVLVQMLLKKEPERPFTPPASFLTDGIPKFFNPARIQLQDEEQGHICFWSNNEKTSQLVSFARNKDKWTAREFTSKRPLNLLELRNPLSGERVPVPDPTRNVELWPTTTLHEMLLQIVDQVAVELPKLKKVLAVPFHISAGRLVLNLPSCEDENFKASLNEEIDPSSVRQFKTALKQIIPEKEDKRLTAQLVQLKEKCAHMTDDNCQNCLNHRQFLCLRSLLARFLTNRQLWMHKGIELSDLEGTITVGDKQSRVWFFSKIAQGTTGLTLRNSSGAILLAQVINQIDKSTFDIVGILTPSVVNQDLKERIVFISGMMGKRVLVLRQEFLQKFLMYFEEQSDFERTDLLKLYSASKSKGIKGKRGQAPGAFA
jgi:hypothetical protein